MTDQSIIVFAKTFYSNGGASVGVGAEAPTHVHLATLTGPELLQMYNELADILGQSEVKRFSDSKTAVKRTWAMLQAYAAAKPETQMKGHVRAADAPHPAIKSITSVSGPALDKQKRQAAAADEAIKAKPVQPPAAAGPAKRSIWRRAKHEAAAKIAYRPEPGTVQAQLYDILTSSPDGLTMEDYCARAAQVKTKDSTLFTPSAVWGALRYLFVTNRGYGLDFDGTRLKLLVPADERQSSRKLKQG